MEILVVIGILYVLCFLVCGVLSVLFHIKYMMSKDYKEKRAMENNWLRDKGNV